MQESLVASGNNVTAGKRPAPCDRHSTRLWLLFRRLEAVREPKRRRKSHWPFIPKFYLRDIVEIRPSSGGSVPAFSGLEGSALSLPRTKLNGTDGAVPLQPTTVLPSGWDHSRCRRCKCVAQPSRLWVRGILPAFCQPRCSPTLAIADSQMSRITAPP